jgi:ATP synthase protein I
MANPRKPAPPPEVADPKLGDISDRLKDLSSRIAAEKSEQAGQAKPAASFDSAKDYSKGYRLASEFVAGVLVGGLIGYGLDRLLGTLPLFLIVFLLFGFGAGILNMSRAANRSQPTAEELKKMTPPKADDDDEEE